MKKYFIAEKYFDSLSNGFYCINTFLNENERFFVTSLTNYVHCNHSQCCGSVLEIKEEYNLTIDFRESINLASGDIDKETNSSVITIIIVYNEAEIKSVLHLSPTLFLQDKGDDCAFILNCLAESNDVKLKNNSHETLDEAQINNQKKNVYLNLCEHSYLYRWMKCRRADLLKRDYFAMFSSQLLECFLMLVLITVCNSCILRNNHWSLASTVESFVNLLRDLLSWLMGVPVGLKLNRQFSRVLGQFYLFHVYIWENYMMSSVLPLIPHFVAVMPFLTPLGISFFFCLALDVSALVTLHLTCFYIYACKLYRLQVIILFSLYRLFRGRKWNPFRERVDTGPAEIDRLFTSTLILALCVFLLPTTALYYLVFSSIEVLLLLNEYLVSGIVQFFQRFQVIDLISWILHQSRHRRIVYLEKVCESEHCLLLRLNYCRGPLLSIFTNIGQDIKMQPQFKPNEMISCLLKGHLVKRL